MIIVTGGAGFIGSVLIHELNQAGRSDIIVVDRFEDDDKWLNLRSLKFERFIHADEFFDLLDTVELENVEAIYHMGAISSTTERDMDLLFKNNVEYSQMLITLAADFDIPICYASSAATYGDGEKGYDDGNILGLKPLNPYGYSKKLVDDWIINQEFKNSWYGVKFFNVYGPNEYHKTKMCSVVYQAFKQITESGKMKLFKSHRDDYKDGEQLRDFVYVKDVCKAMLGLIDKKAESGIYNLGTGQARTFLDLTKATFKAMGIEEKIEFIDMPESLRDQYQYYTQANMDKFKKALPEFAFLSLEQGVADYVENHLLKQRYLES